MYLEIDSYYKDLPGYDISQIELRGISIKQLTFAYNEVVFRCREDGNVSPENVLLSDIMKHIIEWHPCTSYPELIATKPRKPCWYVIFYWQLPLLQMITCLKQHAKDRELSEDNDYYCIYVSSTV